MKLKPYDRELVRRDFLTYDLEWYPSHDRQRTVSCGGEPLQVRLVGVHDGRKYRAYRSIKDFVEGELTRKNSGKLFFAHAGGLFDIQFVFEYILNHCRDKYQIKCAMSGSAAIHVELTRDGMTWHLCDSFWLIRQPLRKIANWIGSEKGGSEGNTDIFWAPIAELIEYNERDCLILHQAISFLQETLLSLGGQLQRTIASCAMLLFRASYLKAPIRTCPNVNEFVRRSYIASRVEIFQLEAQNVNCFDINSSFPHSMTFPCPGSPKRVRKTLPNDDDPYFAECDVHVPDCHLPPLPLRHERSGRIYFPTGRWRSVFSRIDLEFLQECGGRIEKVHRVQPFNTIDDLSQYALDIYGRRQNTTDPAEKEVFKILLNSLYGKFAERPDKTGILIGKDVSDYPVDERRLLAPGIWQVSESVQVPHCHVPISAQITALSRRSLTRLLLQAGDPYYCDTDSIFVADTKQFPTSNELGALKFEGRFDSVEFLAPKLYAKQEGDRWSVKAKGFGRIKDIPDDILPQIMRGEVSSDDYDGRKVTIEDFRKLKRGGALVTDSFSRLRKCLVTPDHKPSAGHTEKRFLGKIRPKRHFRENGSSRPWDVEELDN
jgi:hypothetical protein